MVSPVMAVAGAAAAPAGAYSAMAAASFVGAVVGVATGVWVELPLPFPLPLPLPLLDCVAPVVCAAALLSPPPPPPPQAASRHDNAVTAVQAVFFIQYPVKIRYSSTRSQERTVSVCMGVIGASAQDFRFASQVRSSSCIRHDLPAKLSTSDKVSAKSSQIVRSCVLRRAFRVTAPLKLQLKTADNPENLKEFNT
ncbi:hypothetical protein [Caballeronia sp. LZ034LL]|uniref:hypothetical protein n=1 Tax=Caballeronia sp. LZ034LL TaxID=3038567 RepID=UPI002867276B|nr:hypothetical protein [Caballeronia sp. LZ034LL]MDR5836429.1 hypothetical protein [Caballeronia sp. LZ034LL]